MKKLIAFLLLLTMLTASLAACDFRKIFSKDDPAETTTVDPSGTTKAPEETTTKKPEETTTKKPWTPGIPTPGPDDGGDNTDPLPDNSGSGELEFPQLPI